MLAALMADKSRDPWFVERYPCSYLIAQGLRHDFGIIHEPLGCGAGSPPALVLKSLGQVPVVEGHHRLDAVVTQFTDESAVEVQARLVRSALALGLHTRPGNGETVGIQTELRHNADVIGEPVVVVAGYVPIVVVKDFSRRMGERVPNGHSPTVLVDRSLYLVRRCGGAPKELFWEAQYIAHQRPTSTSSTGVPSGSEYTGA